MNYQNITEELVTMAQKNWAVFTVVSIVFLVCFIRYVTKNGKSRKLSKTLPGEKLFKSGMSLGKTSRKKKGKKQRSTEGVGTDTKKSTTLTSSLENLTKKSEKKKNKAKKKKSSQHDGFTEVTDTITEADDGGEWQVVCTKEQRQAKKERKQRSETSEFGGGDFVTTTTTNRGISNVTNNPSPPSSFQSFSFPSTAKDVAPRFARAAGEEWKENRPKRRSTPPSMSPQRITPSTTQSLLQRNNITSSNVMESMETSMPPLNIWHKEAPVINNTSNNMSGDSWSFQPQLLLQQNLPNPTSSIPLNVAYAGLKTTEQFLHSPWSPMITTATTNIGPNWMSNNGDNSPSSTAASWPNQTNTNNNTTSPYHDIITSAVLSSASTTWSDNGATPATAGPPPSSHCLRSEKQETAKNINNGGDSWSTSSALHHHHHHHHPVDLNAPNHHLHHQNGLGGIWNQYQPPLPSVYNTFGVFPTSDWHLVAPSAYDATNGGGNSVQPVSNLLTTNVPTTQLISTTCATDGVTQENFPPHGEEEIVEADPWNVNPEQPATGDQEMNADWSTPDVNWSNAANDDWQAPAAPVKPAPTYFNDSSDDFVSSSGIRQVSSTTDLSNGNNKKSRRRRRKKQNEMVADVEKQQTSSSSSPPPPSTIVDTATTVAEVVMKQQEVIASQLDDDDASTAVTVGTESDGEWTTPSLLKKRRSRARKED